MATDYISRDDLLERLGIDDLDCTKCSCGDRHGFVCKRGCDFQDACEAIEDAEPADVVPRELYQKALSDVVTLSVERKRGKWKTAYLDHEAFGIRPQVWYCSECHQITSFRTFFCPNCGADMRGDSDV